MAESAGQKQSKRHFVSKELRVSIAFIVIWSLLAGIAFIFLSKVLGKIIQQELVPVVIMIGYVIIVITLTMIFSHRFIGPFERLKMEMRLILAGDYNRRLHLRARDDIYIRSFIEEVNTLLNELEKSVLFKEELARITDSKLLSIISALGEEEVPRRQILENIESCRNTIQELQKKYR